jgi:AcrR family transcriptional regulator
MTLSTSSPSTARQPPVPLAFDRRERKRTRTRLMIQAEALRLFAERGYTQTTVEEIADAAAISPRTFFRYFPTKEDVVIWDEWDPLVADLLDARPDDEASAESIRAITRKVIEGLSRRDPEQLRIRHRLLAEVPELRARFLQTQDTGIELLAAALADKRGLPRDDLQTHVTAAAIGAAVTLALQHWQHDNGNSDLLRLYDRTIDALARGIGELQQRPDLDRRGSRHTAQPGR